MTTATLPDGYLAIGGGYAVAYMRVGIVIRNPQGREIYFPPGDEESATRDSIDALDEVPDDKRDVIADMAFGEYFA